MGSQHGDYRWPLHLCYFKISHSRYLTILFMNSAWLGAELAFVLFEGRQLQNGYLVSQTTLLIPRITNHINNTQSDNAMTLNIYTRTRSYYRGRRGHRLVWFSQNHGYFPEKRSQPGWFWSVLITSAHLILMSGYGYDTIRLCCLLFAYVYCISHVWLLLQGQRTVLYWGDWVPVYTSLGGSWGLYLAWGWLSPEHGTSIYSMIRTDCQPDQIASLYHAWLLWRSPTTTLGTSKV